MAPRPLTAAQAAACENATAPRCACRCGGALHGRSHDQLLALERATGLTWPLAQAQLELPLPPNGEEVT